MSHKQITNRNLCLNWLRNGANWNGFEEGFPIVTECDHYLRFESRRFVTQEYSFLLIAFICKALTQDFRRTRLASGDITVHMSQTDFIWSTKTINIFMSTAISRHAIRFETITWGQCASRLNVSCSCGRFCATNFHLNNNDRLKYTRSMPTIEVSPRTMFADDFTRKLFQNIAYGEQRERDSLSFPHWKV